MKKLLIIMVMLLVLFCGITLHEKLLPDTVHPVEDEIEDTDTDLRPAPDGTGSEGTPSTSGTPSGSVDTDVPDVPPEVTPDAASKPGEASKPDAASKSGEVSKPDAASKSGEASKPDAPSTPEAASKPETSVTPMPDSADTEQDSAAEQEYTGSLLGEPDTDF